METILKKITLTDFRNFNPNVNIQCLGETTNNSNDKDESCWFKIPMDIIIDEEDLMSILPLSKHVCYDEKTGETVECYVLRYYNIKQLYILFDKYDRSTKYYKLVNIKDKNKWMEVKDLQGIDISDIPVYSELPYADDFDDICMYIAVNPYNEEYEKYREKRNELDDILNSYFNKSESLIYSIPFINIPLYIDRNTIDGGALMNDLQKWVPDKIYEKGDIVYYDGYYYSSKENNNVSEIFNNKSWSIIDLAKAPEIKSEQNPYTESKLSSFLSPRKTYDDDGKLVPFIYDRDDNATYQVYLMYKHGLLNYVRKNGQPFVDSLEEVSVHIIGEDDTKWHTLQYDVFNNLYCINATTGGTFEIDLVEPTTATTVNFVEEPNEPTTATTVDRVDINKIDLIKFVYIVGGKCETTEEGETIYEIVGGSGIKYEEIRRCNMKSGIYRITITTNDAQTGQTYTYLEVDTTSVYSRTNNLPVPYAKILDISVNDKYKTWTSGVTYSNGDVVFDDVTNSYYKCINDSASTLYEGWECLNLSHIFVDDRIFGTSYVDLDIPKINVNRGAYAAMERHYVLGEINSFNDLENYRNNLFKV